MNSFMVFSLGVDVGRSASCVPGSNPKTNGLSFPGHFSGKKFPARRHPDQLLVKIRILAFLLIPTPLATRLKLTDGTVGIIMLYANSLRSICAIPHPASAPKVRLTNPPAAAYYPRYLP